MLRAGVIAGGYLYSTASTAASGRELWRTDGTRTGTTLFHQTAGGSASLEPRGLLADSGWIYYDGRGSGRRQAYAFDGTTPQRLGRSHPSVSSFRARGGRVAIFVGNHQFSELQVSDGTPAGSALFADLAPGTVPAHSRFYIPGDLRA